MQRTEREPHRSARSSLRAPSCATKRSAVVAGRRPSDLLPLTRRCPQTRERRLGTGLFGGEGFIMQKLEGDGMAFVHAGGHVFERQLAPGEILRIDTGCLVAYTHTVQYDIQFVGGIRNSIFGGEGLFFATLRGPGTVWIQTLPVSRLASRILAYGTYQRKGEGSILGGLGNLLDGDGR